MVNYKKEVIEKLLPDIFKIMKEINKFDIKNTTGYGVIDINTNNAFFKLVKIIYLIFLVITINEI